MLKKKNIGTTSKIYKLPLPSDGVRLYVLTRTAPNRIVPKNPIISKKSIKVLCGGR